LAFRLIPFGPISSRLGTSVKSAEIVMAPLAALSLLPTTKVPADILSNWVSLRPKEVELAVPRLIETFAVLLRRVTVLVVVTVALVIEIISVSRVMAPGTVPPEVISATILPSSRGNPSLVLPAPLVPTRLIAPPAVVLTTGALPEPNVMKMPSLTSPEAPPVPVMETEPLSA